MRQQPRRGGQMTAEQPRMESGGRAGDPASCGDAPTQPTSLGPPGAPGGGGGAGGRRGETTDHRSSTERAGAAAHKDPHRTQGGGPRARRGGDAKPKATRTQAAEDKARPAGGAGGGSPL